MLTARTIEGGPVTDRFLGGLDHQIKHRLLAGTPRPHLPACARPGPWSAPAARGSASPTPGPGAADSCRQVLAHLREVGEVLRCAA
ncbi:hypothetical protein SJI45_27310 [Streptomyces sp. S399]|uniref:hypothetical protein n=1 Tax=Streptomyces TaxID=1883 RepID=UPI0013C6E934|nr:MULTISPECIES: hypothetical protein [Streptomyces]WPR54167.1 hypothetical protein SJI45_27310 [Streptomyces sp. S399]GFH68796.1 hypothetical protein Srut_53100 [Streptomyces rutgersensis]